MIENNNFPWYLQQSPVFLALYTGFFDIAVDASPLELGTAFDINNATGEKLYRLGTYWGMAGAPYVWDGLIYDIDKWSDIKNWTGGLKELSENFYANLIRAKAYAYGRPYSLTTLYGVLERVFEGFEYSAVIYEVGTLAETEIDLGSVADPAESTENYGTVDDDTTETLDYGTLTANVIPENIITISITANEEVLRSFIEAKAFDIAFIGKPCGIKVQWEYNYI